MKNNLTLKLGLLVLSAHGITMCTSPSFWFLDLGNNPSSTSTNSSQQSTVRSYHNSRERFFTPEPDTIATIVATVQTKEVEKSVTTQETIKPGGYIEEKKETKK